MDTEPMATTNNNSNDHDNDDGDGFTATRRDNNRPTGNTSLGHKTFLKYSLKTSSLSSNSSR